MPEVTGDPNKVNPDDLTTLTGTCLCGSIRVTINDPDLFTRRRGHLCHCANCRKVAGSYVAANLLIENDKVEIEDKNGTLKEFKDTETMSGTPVGRWFCSTCGNPIKSVVPAYGDKVVLKMGIFPRIPAPEFETFGLHRHPWQGLHESMEQYKLKAGGEKLETPVARPNEQLVEDFPHNL
ncbi:hypothetical protein H2201_003181 [Coniosporium apollinis]|uniref:CENP-V/GFA domain-containing protein n=2 Tax=Coniosporium TaxID=2810619 RepID=A0ABQ9NXF8_9PEZI|nr:hypothetical protein H2199_008523 [Cladosporium sp. JES 115]KAJ9666777.1 hypothetical protein H2201_003181 [Coniosporium apollinis]